MNTMEQAAEQAATARDRLAAELRSLVSDAEEMLKAASRSGNDQLNLVRERLERGVGAARDELNAFQEAAFETARRTAADTNEYVHEHPWNAVGIAAAVGVLLGVLLTRR
ncbi:MAG: DUF883 family protein [Burkholderiaceae bacterium]|nr:DUF883 family protein [Burkholderiaceae bacterium]